MATIKKLSLLCMFLMAFVNATYAGDGHIKVMVVDSCTIGHTSKHSLFGGISALDWMPENAVFNNTDSKTTLLLFSDHTPNRAANGTVQRTMVFRYEPGTKSWTAAQPFDSTANGAVNSIECVRYSKALHSIFYSYESDAGTGIVRWAKDKTPDTIYQQPIPPHRDNRGIEGITLTDDESLWYVLEAGDGTEHDNDSSSFVCIPYNKATKKHNIAAKTIYRYAFNKCSCIPDNCDGFNGQLGGGISEILAIPQNMGGGFLVLERCFNGKEAHVNLFRAITTKGSKTLTKTLLLDFNAAHLNPDNLEGMAWEPGSGTTRTLDVVSDDNFNEGRQRTQFVRLRVAL